jgi:hypothetical protein
MNANELSKVTIPILHTFKDKLTFDDNLWVETYIFDGDECQEFLHVNNKISIPKTVFSAAGFVKNERGQEFQAYVIYANDDTGLVYFLTIHYGEKAYTYDYFNTQWVTWQYK